MSSDNMTTSTKFPGSGMKKETSEPNYPKLVKIKKSH